MDVSESERRASLIKALKSFHRSLRLQGTAEFSFIALTIIKESLSNQKSFELRDAAFSIAYIVHKV